MLVKVCGITRRQDASLLSAVGVDMCGFIFHEGSPRYLSPEAAAGLHTGDMRRVGVFVGQDAAETRRIMETARLHFAQLHGNQSPQCGRRIGPERIIRVIWPARHASAEALQRALDVWADSCAYYLVDAGLGGGGSGQRCDTALLARVRFPHPWLLAGGVDVADAAQLAQCFSPSGLDFNSSLEDGAGVKNHDKLRALGALLPTLRRI